MGKSILFKFIVVIFSGLFIVMLGWSLYEYKSEESALVDALNDDSELILKRLAINLENPIWNDDTESSEKNILMEMPANIVVCILVYNTDKELLFAKINNSDKTTRDYTDEDRLALENNRLLFKKTAPITMEEKHIGECLIYFSKSVLNLKLTGLFKKIIAQTLFLWITIFILIITTVRVMILKNLSLITVQMKEISQGEGDLTKKLDIKTGDEVGRLSNYFDLFIDKLHDDVALIKKSVLALETISKGISTISTTISSGSTEQSANIQDVLSTLEDFIQLFEEITGYTIAGQNLILQKTISGIEFLSANAKDIYNKIENLKTKSADDIASVKTSIGYINHSFIETDRMNNKIQDVAIQIKAVGDNLYHIDNVLQVIKELSDRANILSMNAAIEAACAGDAGKGFSIVAEEIAKFAQNSEIAARDISTITSTINQSVKQAIAITGESELLSIEGKKTSKEAKASLEGIMLNIMAIESIVTQVSAAIAGQDKETQKVIKDVELLKTSSSNITISIEQQTEHINQIRDSVLKVSKTTETNNEVTLQLTRLSGELKIRSMELSSIVQLFKLKDHEK